MFTLSEYYELKTNCTWEWTTLDGQTGGFLVTSEKNGNSIFLPSSRPYFSDSEDNPFWDIIEYWTSTLRDDKPSQAWGVLVGHGMLYSDLNVEERAWGKVVRPVMDYE